MPATLTQGDQARSGDPDTLARRKESSPPKKHAEGERGAPRPQHEVVDEPDEDVEMEDPVTETPKYFGLIPSALAMEMLAL